MGGPYLLSTSSQGAKLRRLYVVAGALAVAAGQCGWLPTAILLLSRVQLQALNILGAYRKDATLRTLPPTPHGRQWKACGSHVTLLARYCSAVLDERASLAWTTFGCNQYLENVAYEQLLGPSG